MSKDDLLGRFEDVSDKGCHPRVRFSSWWLIGLFVVVVLVTILHYFFGPDCGC